MISFGACLLAVNSSVFLSIFDYFRTWFVSVLSSLAVILEHACCLFWFCQVFKSYGTISEHISTWVCDNRDWCMFLLFIKKEEQRSV